MALEHPAGGLRPLLPPSPPPDGDAARGAVGVGEEQGPGRPSSPGTGTAHVSPGEPLYAHRGEGQQMLEEARLAGQVPQSRIHEKEIFR